MMSNIFSTPEFESAYTYTGNDLGAVWTPKQTAFRVWAPTADKVWVNLYASGTPGTDDLLEQVEMTPDVNGTWVAAVEGDRNGVYYTYVVEVEGMLYLDCTGHALYGRLGRVVIDTYTGLRHTPAGQ